MHDPLVQDKCMTHTGLIQTILRTRPELVPDSFRTRFTTCSELVHDPLWTRSRSHSGLMHNPFWTHSGLVQTSSRTCSELVSDSFRNIQVSIRTQTALIHDSFRTHSGVQVNGSYYIVVENTNIR